MNLFSFAIGGAAMQALGLCDTTFFSIFCIVNKNYGEKKYKRRDLKNEKRQGPKKNNFISLISSHQCKTNWKECS